VARHVILWTGAACAGVFVLADFIIRILYSSAYAPAAVALRWLLPGILMLSIGKVLIAELLAREKITFTFWVGAVVVATNIAGNFLLIPRMGIAGASLASSISYTLLSIIVCWYYLKQTGVRWTRLVPCWADVQAYYALVRRHAPAVVAKVAGD
jgi:O-antigen/teichoic acid export membrane protein